MLNFYHLLLPFITDWSSERMIEIGLSLPKNILMCMARFYCSRCTLIAAFYAAGSALRILLYTNNNNSSRITFLRFFWKPLGIETWLWRRIESNWSSIDRRTRRRVGLCRIYSLSSGTRRSTTTIGRCLRDLTYDRHTSALVYHLRKGWYNHGQRADIVSDAPVWKFRGWYSASASVDSVA